MPIKTKTSSDIGGGQTGCSLSSVKADFSPSYSIQGCPQVHNHFLLPHTSQYTQHIPIYTELSIFFKVSHSKYEWAT